MTGATVRQCVVRVGDPAMASRMVGGRSCLGWLVREFSRFGVSDVLLLGDGGTADVAAGLPRPVEVAVARVSAGAGFGGALWQVRDRLHDRFLVCDGAAMFDCNLARLLADWMRDAPDLVGRVVSGSGIGVFRNAVVAHLRPVCSLWADVLPDLAERGLLGVTALDGRADAGTHPPRQAVDSQAKPHTQQDKRAVGTGSVDPVLSSPSWPAVSSWPSAPFRSCADDRDTPGHDGKGPRSPLNHSPDPAYPDANAARPGHDTVVFGPVTIARLRRKALFLDRDGVLNIDHGYVGSRDRFEWVDGALDAIRYATEAGWHVFVVTNQSGVARGLYAEDAVLALLDWMAGEVRAAGGTIDDARFCPFHPDAAVDAYRQAHPWRKPLPGMLLDLIRAWQLDPKRAVMIGDQETDMRAAAAAGVAGHLFRGGNLLAFLRPILDRLG